MGFIALATILMVVLFYGFHIVLIQAMFAGFELVWQNKRIPYLIKVPLFLVEIVVGAAWPFILRPELSIKEKLAFSFMGVWLSWAPNLVVLLIDQFCYYHLPSKTTY